MSVTFDVKLRIDAATMQAIELARANPAEWILPSGRSIPPSRVEMIRRLITRGLDADKTTAAKIADAKRRTAASRARKAAIEAEQFEKRLDAMSPTGRFFGREK